MEGKKVVTWLGIGLIPSRTRERLNPGHAWLFWDKTEQNKHEPYRGFWPDLDELPEEPKERRKLYRTTAVKALIRVDLQAQEYMNMLSKQIITVQWPINSEQFNRLQEMVYVPRDKKLIDCAKYLYSWKEDLKSSHNCSSWAIEAVNYVMGEEFVKCDRPKQLKYVQLALEALESKIKGGV